jgi:hypothetical protein
VSNLANMLIKVLALGFVHGFWLYRFPAEGLGFFIIFF